MPRSAVGSSRFIDDMDLLLAEDHELVVRSASRLGRRDLGVNGRRVERLRAALAEAGLLASSSPPAADRVVGASWRTQVSPVRSRAYRLLRPLSLPRTSIRQLARQREVTEGALRYRLKNWRRGTS